LRALKKKFPKTFRHERNNNSRFANHSRRFIFIAMSSVQEIEAVIPKLTRAEVEEVRAWIDDFLEDQLELTDDVKAKLDQSRREIADGNYTTRQPK
jgi:glutamine synthetase type III